MLNRTGAVVTIEARGCQGEIARQLQAQGADDGLSLQEHQPRLYRDGADLFAWLRGPQPRDQPAVLGDDAPVDGGHGRIETRRVWSTEALAGVVSGERWPGLTSLVRVASIRQLGEEESVEQRYYLSSLPGATDDAAKRFNRVIRTHGEIENRVHWVLDVAMGEDGNRARKGESAQNLALMRTLALNVWRQEHSFKGGIAAKQKRAGWEHDYLLKILSPT
jgi:predicted transposase YbfD/YdcC